MAEFRKLFLVLAAIAAFSVSGYAQYTCIGNPGANKALRGGGITELLGDVVLTCSDATPVAQVVASTVTGSYTVQISNGANTVTNKIGDLDTDLNAYPIQAAAEVRDLNNHVLQVVPGYLSADNPSLVLFPNVILPTATSGVRIRFTNIRVKADPVAAGSAPVQVYATVGTAEGNLPLTNSLQSPGLIYPSLAFSVTDCAGGTVPSLAYQQCISEPKAGEGALSFGLRFQENTTTSAFRVKRSGALNPLTAYEDGNNGDPVTGPATYTIATAGGASTPGTSITIQDVADYSTRLVARFTNVPNGVHLFVTTREVSTMSTATATARLITGTDDNGVGGSVATTDSTTALTCDKTFTTDPSGNKTLTPLVDNNTNPVRLAEITDTDANGNLFAVFEVTANVAASFEHLGFGVQVVYDANPGENSPAVSTAAGTISGLYAPISTVLTADADAKVPRFVDNPITASSPFSIGPCVTNLLFPYVTQLAGYNTGIALVNTSKDNAMASGETAAPFNTSAQTGGCTVYFFGANAPAAPVWRPNPADTTTTIAPGTLDKFVVGDVAPDFEGYVIARCNFQYAHGLAFILAPGGSGSEYLALVIPDRADQTRLPDPFTVAGAGSGEQLGY